MAMAPIVRAEILAIAEYEGVRPHFRQRVIAAKKPRRVHLGDDLTILFENRDTVLLQIQEMLRTERITSEPAILHEIETYNELLPQERQLSLTLFVEIPDRERREASLARWVGLERHVWLEVDGERFAALGKTPDTHQGRTTAVHYLKIDLSDAAAAKLAKAEGAVALVVDHPELAARTELSRETRSSLAGDLA